MGTTKENEASGQVTILAYKKGEQIFKQNDYGVSIYKILEGKVEIFREHGGIEIPLGILKSGNIIGEMAFLTKGTDVRYSSARALEDSRLEVWHPDELLKEYEQVSPVLKYIANQTLTRLFRMNKFMERFVIEREKIKERMGEEKEAKPSQRRFYRKKVNIPCTYVPAQESSLSLRGTIKDISMTGLGFEADPRNDALASHNLDDMFFLSFVLPKGKDLKVLGKIVHVTKKRDSMRIGMVFPEKSEYIPDVRKALGFFLMPT